MLLAASGLLTGALVMLVRTRAADWLALGDHGAIALRVRAVGGRHTPLVGPYSRYGWNHPGPLLFYVLALPYRLLGARSSGLLVGALLVNVAAGATTLVYVARRASTAGVLVATLVLAVLVRAVGPTELADPWNPFVVTLPLLATVVLAWSLAAGDWSAVVPAVAFASFSVQSHVGSAPVAFAPVAVGIALGLTGPSAGRRRRPVAVLLAAVVLLWLPPVIDQVRPGGGNLTRMWRFFTSDQRRQGLAWGARQMSSDLSLAGPWLTGRQSLNVYSGAVTPGWAVPVALVALAAAGGLAWRRDRAIGRLLAVVGVTVLAAWIASAQIVEPAYPYLVRNNWAVAAAVWLATGCALCRAVAGQARRVAGVVAVTAAVAVGGAFTAASFGADPANSADIPYLRPVRGVLLDRLAELPAPILVRSTSFTAGVVSTGIVAEAANRRIDVRMPSDADREVGPAYVVEAERARTSVLVAVDGQIAALRRRADLTLIVAYDSLSRQDRARIEAFRRRFANPPPGVDADTFVRRMARESRRLPRQPSFRLAVFAVRTAS